jgi:small subunit ribosomal protein S17
MNCKDTNVMQDKKVRTMTCAVISISGDKSIQVAREYKVKHPKYGKYVKRRIKVAVHDQQNVSRIGDLVEVSECRPLSKTKSWRVVKVVQTAR